MKQLKLFFALFFVTSVTFSADINDIGTITQIKVHGSLLYVAGQKGVAAMTSAYEIKWLLILPESSARFIEADDSGIAYTAYHFDGIEDVKNPLLWGSNADIIQCSNCVVGLINSNGTKVWEQAIDSKTRLAPPAMSATRIAVNSSNNLYVIVRTDGSQKAKLDNQDTFGKKLTEGTTSQFLPNEPLIYDGNIYSCGFYRLEKCDLDGNELIKTRGWDLMKPFESLTTSPYVFDDKIIFGNTSNTVGESAYPSKIFATYAELKNDKWTEFVDKSSGVGSIATGSDYFVTASNFIMKSYSTKGKENWSFKIGLPSNRGVRFHNNTNGHRLCQGNFLSVENDIVYIANWKKVKKGQPNLEFITEVNGKTGKFIKNVNMPNEVEIEDMQLLGKNIIILTVNGLVSLEK